MARAPETPATASGCASVALPWTSSGAVIASLPLALSVAGQRVPSRSADDRHRRTTPPAGQRTLSRTDRERKVTSSGRRAIVTTPLPRRSGGIIAVEPHDSHEILR